MATTQRPTTLSDRLGRVQRDPSRVATPEADDKARCASSVMAGQRCARPAVVGGKLCASHLAMQDGT